MLKIGLTGLIGSGKSTVAKVFEALGVLVYYSDIEAKEIINNNKEVKSQIIDLFGQESYHEGKYQTTYIASKVFNDTILLEKLNAIVHPKVEQSFELWCNEQKTAQYVLKESALIFQLGLDKKLDAVIFVKSNVICLTERIMKRDNLSYEQAQARVLKQLESLPSSLNAGFNIENNIDSEVLPQVLKIHEAINARAN